MGKITVATSSGSKPVKSDGLASQGQKRVSRSSSITTFDSSCILPRRANKKTPTLHRMNGAFWTAVYAWMSVLWNLVRTPFWTTFVYSWQSFLLQFLSHIFSVFSLSFSMGAEYVMIHSIHTCIYICFVYCIQNICCRFHHIPVIDARSCFL